MERSESIKEIATALSKAQGEYKGAVKKATNPAFKKPGEEGTKYADLEADFHCIQEPFSKHGLSITQSVVKGEPYLATTIMHISGEWITSYVPFKPADGATAQLIKSFTTYAKRNGLEAAAAIPSTDDDDGNVASGKTKPEEKSPQSDPAKDYFLSSHPDEEDMLPFDAFPDEKPIQTQTKVQVDPKKSKSKNAEVMTFGSHKGKTFGDLLQYPGYLFWVKDEVLKDPTKRTETAMQMQRLVEYATQEGVIK